MPKTKNNPVIARSPGLDPGDEAIQKIISDYPEYNFRSGPKFAFHPPKTIKTMSFSLYLDEIQGRAEQRNEPYSGIRRVSSAGSDAEVRQIQRKYALLSLHELSHAILKHKDYNTIISRLKHERDAWNYVKTHLAPHYQIPYDEDFAESQLDTYRDHLHQKSLCPNCQTVRYQDPEGTFHCPLCP